MKILFSISPLDGYWLAAVKLCLLARGGCWKGGGSVAGGWGVKVGGARRGGALCTLVGRGWWGGDLRVEQCSWSWHCWDDSSGLHEDKM